MTIFTMKGKISEIYQMHSPRINNNALDKRIAWCWHLFDKLKFLLKEEDNKKMNGESICVLFLNILLVAVFFSVYSFQEVSIPLTILTKINCSVFHVVIAFKEHLESITVFFRRKSSSPKVCKMFVRINFAGIKFIF